MSYDADTIVDRRRMRRKLTRWRIAAVLLAIVAVVGVGILLRGDANPLTGVPGQIARVNIEGLIRSNRQRTEALDRLGRSSVRAVVVRINSPGGTVSGSEQLYDSLARLKRAEAAGGGGRRPCRLGWLYRGDGRRPYRGAAERHRRFDRRPFPISRMLRSF